MTLIRYEPWHVVDRLHRQIDQIFGDSFASPAANWRELRGLDSHGRHSRGAG